MIKYYRYDINLLYARYNDYDIYIRKRKKGLLYYKGKPYNKYTVTIMLDRLYDGNIFKCMCPNLKSAKNSVLNYLDLRGLK